METPLSILEALEECLVEYDIGTPEELKEVRERIKDKTNDIVTKRVKRENYNI